MEKIYVHILSKEAGSTYIYNVINAMLNQVWFYTVKTGKQNIKIKIVFYDWCTKKLFPKISKLFLTLYWSQTEKNINNEWYYF